LFLENLLSGEQRSSEGEEPTHWKSITRINGIQGQPQKIKRRNANGGFPLEAEIKLSGFPARMES
jgi:hypothetical protein